MGTRVEKIVVSGPGPDGTWYWRPHDGSGDTQTVDTPLIDFDWTSGDIVEMRVRREMGNIELVGPTEEPEVEEAPILVNGEPLDLPADDEIEPGDVIYAVVRFGRPANRVERDRVGKRRPVVVVGLEGGHLVVRPIFSRNTEGRGQRLREPNSANLSANSILGHDEELITRADMTSRVGELADADRAWVLRS
ncbi:MAG: hypothetical protein H8E69_00680 [Actinobacteria bacterium]|nr:hypothetical protein [Actinomycetota bacterium]